MNYKSYGNKKSAPSRMARKRSRSTVFQYNKKLRKVTRKLKNESKDLLTN